MLYTPRIGVFHLLTMPAQYAEQGPWNGTVSVCLPQGYRAPASAHSRKCVAGLLLWARRAGDIDRLLQQRRAKAGSATLSAYVVAEHRLVFLRFCGSRVELTGYDGQQQ